MPVAKLELAAKSEWSQVVTYAGNDSYLDHGQNGKQVVMPWDGKCGSGAMNSRDWLQSIWMGQMSKLCSVESAGTVNALFVWKGKGPAPTTVDVEIESEMVARYCGGDLAPTVLLSNGLGSRTNYTTRLGGPSEASARESKTVNLVVENGIAKLKMGVSGRLSGLMNGFVALHSKLNFRVR